jgi:thioredoxin 1
MAAYSVAQPQRSEIDALPGVVALEFGTDWCGFCRGAALSITTALGAHPEVRHMKVEDGPGRPLGRSFRIKLWPTVVVLRDGKEVGRTVRPASPEDVEEALAPALTA